MKKYDTEAAARIAELEAELSDAMAALAAMTVERDAAAERVAALEADAMKAMHESSVLKRLEYNRVGDAGHIEAVVQSPFMRILAEWIAADFKANGGTNYVEQELSFRITDHSEPQAYTVLVQKVGAKTPAKVAGELRKERDDQAEAVRVLGEEVRAARVMVVPIDQPPEIVPPERIRQVHLAVHTTRQATNANPIARAAVEHKETE